MNPVCFAQNGKKPGSLFWYVGENADDSTRRSERLFLAPRRIRIAFADGNSELFAHISRVNASAHRSVETMSIRGLFLENVPNGVHRWRIPSIVACAAASFVLAASVAWSQQEAKSTPSVTGLQGILPVEVPLDLTDETFAELDGNWADWSTNLADLVFKLYEDDSLDTAAQRELLAELQSKLTVMRTALADDRYQSLLQPLVSVEGKLSRRIDVAQAVLDSLELRPETVKAARVDAERLQLRNAIEEIRSDLGQFANGSGWLRYVQADQLDRLTSPPATEANAAGDEELLTVLRAVREKLRQADQLEMAEQRDFLDREAFTSLAGAIDSYLKATQSEATSADLPRAREQFALLIEALEDYETSSSARDASRVHEALQAVRGLVLDGGDRISSSLARNYLRDNLHISASERFLSRLVFEEQTDSGEVRDYVLGANVYGDQTTTSQIGVDVKPSSGGALFDLTLTGVTRSNTAGYTSQATIYTDGYHRFRAAKEVFFDGHKFTVKPGTIHVDANNRTTGASTDFDGWPILSSIGRSMAKREARRKRPQSEAISRDRISKRVVPEFDERADKSVDDANTQLKTGLAQRLKKAGVQPQTRSFETSSTHARLHARLADEQHLAGSAPPLSDETADGIVMDIHQSFLDAVADQLNFAGRTMTEEQVRTELGAFFTIIVGDEVDFSRSESEKADADEGPSVLIFAEQDPIRFRIEDGYVKVIIRTGFQQEEKENIPTKIIAIPFRYRVEGDDIVIERGTVRVAPIGRQRRHIAHAGVIRKKLQSALPDRTRSRTIALKREGKDDLPLHINKFQALNGWLTVWGE